MEAERLQRARQSLEGLSLGDAYGNHHGSNTRKHASPVWEYTDDTEMALSIFWSLRRYGRIEQDQLAQRFAVYRNGNRGYGKGVTALLKKIGAGGDWRKAAFEMFDGQGSYGNGAAMRVAPVGAYFADDMEMAIEQARLSAEVTHAHPEGIAGAIAVAVGAAVAYTNRNGRLEQKQFLAAVCEHVPDSEIKRKIDLARDLECSSSPHQAAELLGNGRPSLAQFTVPFALWSASRFLSNYEEAIRKTASVGGDVDTNCAIVGGIVSLIAPPKVYRLTGFSDANRCQPGLSRMLNMTLQLESYLTQLERWPKTGRHILAQYDDETVVVYQAYAPEIGHFAARHGYFGDGFSLNRMSWIKPNFLWMMFRSGWGTKPGQEVVLAVWLKRSAFDSILAQAAHSTYQPNVYDSYKSWQADVAHSPVRLQWDPDHHPSGAKLERRAIQLGLRGPVLASYAREWIVHLEDISSLVAEQRQYVTNRRYSELLTPRETVYPVSDESVARKLQVGPTTSSASRTDS